MTLKNQFLFGVLVLLALVGFIDSLMHDLLGVILTLSLAIAFYFIIRHFTGKSSSVDFQYKQALRRQKKKMKQKPRNKTAQNVPFKVIEGKKGKSKEDKYLH